MSVRKLKKKAQSGVFLGLWARAMALEASNRPWSANYKVRYFWGVFKALRRNGAHHHKAGVTA